MHIAALSERKAGPPGFDFGFDFVTRSNGREAEMCVQYKKVKRLLWFGQVLRKSEMKNG